MLPQKNSLVPRGFIWNFSKPLSKDDPEAYKQGGGLIRVWNFFENHKVHLASWVL